MSQRQRTRRVPGDTGLEPLERRDVQELDRRLDHATGHQRHAEDRDADSPQAARVTAQEAIPKPES